MTKTTGQLKGPEAVDRRELAKNPPTSSGEGPRTDRRVRRLESALRHRQLDAAIVLENVHDLHNISAVLRTCDAVGIPQVHLIYTIEEPPQQRFARRVSAGTAKWIETVRWPSVEACYTHLREQGMAILATAISERAESLFDCDLARPVAIVFGNEMRGLTDEAIAQADGEVFIPMVGLVQSLNISVSCAVMLYELFRQRSLAGSYNAPTMSDDEISTTLESWLRQ